MEYGKARTPAAVAVEGIDDGLVVDSPLEEEIWFEQSGREQAGAGPEASMGSSRALGTSSSSLMPPIGENKSPLPPVASQASGLLYEPPHWGGAADTGGGGGGGSRSRQASDASSTASAAASVRDMFKYIRSKAAAVATTATAAAYYSSDDNASTATAASNNPATTTGAAAAPPPPGRTIAADSISSLNYSSGGDGEGNNGGGSLPTTPGVPDVDEALPPAELWGGERKGTAKAAACASAQAEARDVAEAAQRAARDASDASNQSKAQTLLSMVRPSYWRTASSEGVGGGDEPAAGGALGGGGGGGDNGRGSLGLIGAGSSVDGNGSWPVDDSAMGSLCELSLACPPISFFVKSRNVELSETLDDRSRECQAVCM